MDWNALIRPQVGPMVPYAPGLRASEVRAKSGKEVIRKLSSNENPYGPFPSAIEGMRAVLPFLNRYPDGAERELKRRLAEKLGVEERHLVVGNGSNELLTLIAQTVLGAGDEVVFAWPSFVVYPMCAQLTCATAVKVPLTEAQVHDLPAMLAAITDKTKLVFLCNPNNPTGTIYERGAFEQFLAAVPEHVLVVVDEAYFEYATSSAFPNGLDFFDGTRPIAILRTFSKIYSLAGARIGYGIAPEQLVEAIDKVREPFNVSSVAQVGAYYSLADDAEVERRRRENQEQKAYLYSCFDRLGISYVPSETNFVYMGTEKPVEVFEALLAEGIIVRGFGAAPALRVGVGTPEDTNATVAALEATVAKLGSI
ncbi:MAG TPA: histidinol-phosphate transaminase [Coriobacteriia bacterium]